ncbi:MAG TPA: hypothetical protein VMU94_26175 [Streptosporangiaceae bacterium]|nr:hypothetical protein [Streptosporangiaceae bacterium]
MHPRGSVGRAGGQARARAGSFIALVLLLTAAAAGCSHNGSPSPGGATVTSCGTAKTAADVPVKVEVAHGHVRCSTAKTVEADYAEAIRSGKAPGNGGGGPVKVKGWTCQGFATPIVLHTGNASKCVRDGDEILEILPPPPSPSAS